MSTSCTVDPFTMRPLGVVMAPQREDPREREGVLNPAAARGPDGALYLFPRLVGPGNYSRIGIARVRFDARGDPAGVERLGVVLEPEEPYEKNPHSGGGCEDPRITYVEPLGCYLMTYTAFSPRGARIALATSHDLFTWKRLGLVRFSDPRPLDFNDVDNKDALLFPRYVPNARGAPSLALVHRPLFPGTHPHQILRTGEPPSTRRPRVQHESLWISYCDLPVGLEGLGAFHDHRRLMSPRASWERVKVGGGTPPLLTRHGWLMLYHGVSGAPGNGAKKALRYSAGAVVLERDHPERIAYRTPHPILTADAFWQAVGEHDLRQEGLAPNVVFPTGVDVRTDLGQPDRVDVYFGVADDRIGAAALTIPGHLPDLPERPEEQRDAPDAAR